VTNLSEWALRHRSFTVFLMIVVTLAGLSSYFGLGRNEDPAFTFRTMVVQAAWPGATLDDTLKQVTERIERKLQETRGLDFLRSYTTPGLTTIFVNLKGSTSASEVPDVWYQVRKNIGDIRHTLPVGVVGPGFNDDFGDTFGLIYGFTADGFTHRELRDYVEAVRSRLLNVPDVSKIEIIGAQDEQIFIEFSTQQLAGLGIDRAALIAAVQAQNSVVPAGSVQTSNEKLSLQVSGDFRSEQDILNVNFLSNGRMIRLRDIAEVRRAYADPPQPMFRVNGKPAIGLAIAMRDGGDILTLGRNVKKAIDDAVIDLPLGIDRLWSRTSPRRRSRHRRVHDLAVAGHRHHHGGEHHQPRPPARRHRRGVDLADARHHLSHHADVPHRSAAHFARRPDHRAQPAGRQRHDHGRCHDHAHRPGRQDRGCRFLRLQVAGLPHADRHLRHGGGLRADRLRAERRRRIHLLDLRRRDHCAVRVVVRRRAVRTVAGCRAAEAAEVPGAGQA
jgi:hypothetical protein